LQRKSTHPKADSRHGFRGIRQQGRTGRMVQISRGRTPLNVHINRGGQQLCFLRVLARTSRLSYNINWQKNQGRSWARFFGQRKSIQCVSIMGAFFKVLACFSRHLYCWVFCTVLAEFWAQTSRTVCTAFIAGTVVQCTNFWDRNREAFPDSWSLKN